MQIELHIKGFNEGSFPSGWIKREGTRWEIPDGLSVESLISEVSHPLEGSVLVLINASYPTIGQIIKQGDRLQIYPPLSGG